MKAFTERVELEFKNSEANKPGIPLPKGKVRFYTQDAADASLQFVGENRVAHTPKDELLRLVVGHSFDLVGERKRTDFKVSKANHRAARLRPCGDAPILSGDGDGRARWCRIDLDDSAG